MFYVYTRAYCGMTLTHGEFETAAEAHERAKKRRAWLEEQGCNIDPLSPQSWEIGEPDNCMFIPDYVGVLHISTKEPTL